MATETFVEHPLACPKCNGKLFVECVPTRDGTQARQFWCALCDQVSPHVDLRSEPVGVRIPGVSATRAQVEAAAGQLGAQRHARWRACGHLKNLLVQVSDSDLRYCPRCLALYDGEELLNEPKAAGA